MHKMLIVIGDDVNVQMHAAGVADWWAIGGRYTGHLPLKPGRAGKTYGYSVSAIEAELPRELDLPDDSILHRTTDRGDGVDQARAEDVDMERVGAVGLVHNGEMQIDMSFEVAPETFATSIAMGLGLEVSPEDAERAADALGHWDALIQDQLAQVPDDALLTIVDAHY